MEGLRDFRATMEAIAENLRKEVSDERARREADRLDHQRQIDAVQARVRDLERERLQHRGAIEALNQYARALVRLLRQHNITPPNPPEGFTERTWP
jgi:hypothetical protein